MFYVVHSSSTLCCLVEFFAVAMCVVQLNPFVLLRFKNKGNLNSKNLAKKTFSDEITSFDRLVNELVRSGSDAFAYLCSVDLIKMHSSKGAYLN